MFIRILLKQGTKILLPGLAIFLGYMTFGYAEFFDRLFLLIIFILLLINIKRKHIDLAGVLLIILIEQLGDEFFYFATDYTIIRPLTYAVACYLLIKFNSDKLVMRLALPIILICMGAELYWYVIDYPAPQLHFYIALILLSLLTRHLLFLRVILTEQYTQRKADFLALDWQLYEICTWSIVIMSLMLAEYIVRHCTHYSPMFVYNNYPQITHTFTVLIIFYIMQQSFKNFYVLDA